MFATITYKGNHDDAIRIQPASAHNFGGRRPARLACIECRAKKVKCTGEREGCSKCRANGARCEYPPSSERGVAGRRRTTTGNSTTTSMSSSAANQSDRNRTKETENDRESNVSPTEPNMQSSTQFSHDLGSIQSSTMSMNPGMGDASPIASSDLNVLLDYITPQSFDANNKDFLLGAAHMDDNFMYEVDEHLEDLISPATPSFNDIGLVDLPTSDFATTPQRSESPQLRPSSATTGSSTIQHDTQAGKSYLFSEQLPCLCSQSAIHLLEELQSKDYSNFDLAIDIVLSYQKTSLLQLEGWLTCKHCHTPKATPMVLALITERLSLYLEKGVAHSGVLQRGIKRHSSTYSTPVVVGIYQLESKHELVDVTRVLLLIRCRELVRVLAELKERGVSDAMLTMTERRVKRVMSEVESWEEHCSEQPSVH